jgi:hypothetical protein
MNGDAVHGLVSGSLTCIAYLLTGRWWVAALAVALLAIHFGCTRLRTP